jgi:hypothetical protein
MSDVHKSSCEPVAKLSMAFSVKIVPEINKYSARSLLGGIRLQWCKFRCREEACQQDNYSLELGQLRSLEMADRT